MAKGISFDSYNDTLAKHAPLTKEELKKLFALRDKRENGAEAEKAWQKAREKIIVSNLRFVIKIAYQYHRGYELPLDDLVQEGTLGLMRAIETFDPKKGFTFCTYTVHRILLCVREYVMKFWAIVRQNTTADTREQFFSLKNKSAAIAAAEENKKDIIKINFDLNARPLNSKPKGRWPRDFSLNRKVKNNNESTAATLSDFLQGNDLSPETAAIDNQKKKYLEHSAAHALAILDSRERYVINHRLMSEAPKPLKEISDIFRVSRQRVSQLNKRALKKMKKKLAANGMEDLLLDLLET